MDQLGPYAAPKAEVRERREPSPREGSYPLGFLCGLLMGPFGAASWYLVGRPRAVRGAWHGSLGWVFLIGALAIFLYFVTTP